jgi:hypothetical protein
VISFMIACAATFYGCFRYASRRERAEQHAIDEYIWSPNQIDRLLAGMGYVRCARIECGVYFDPAASNASMPGLHCSAECEVKALEKWVA